MSKILKDVPVVEVFTSQTNSLTPVEVINAYSSIGHAKVERPLGRMLLLAVLAGIFMAFGGAASNMAAHSLTDPGQVRLISGLLFAFGLPLVMLTGAELFTGNILICVTVFMKGTTVAKAIRNWFFVYLGNFAGAVLIAVCCAFFGQFDYAGGGLALYSMKVAAGKCALSFPNALVLGFLGNMLVCLGVLCSLTAKDTAGRMLGAYLPVALFVIAGFEHSIANMFYIPAGLFALQVPKYAQMAVLSGLDLSRLTWRNFLCGNLLPVTLGNVMGGLAVGGLMWAAHIGKKTS